MRPDVLRRALRRLASSVPRRGPRAALEAELAALRARLAAVERGWPPGHFYSPIPSLDEVRARAGTIFDPDAPVPGVDLNDAGQLAMFARLAPFAAEPPFTDAPAPPRRYYAENPNFRVGEAAITYAMLRAIAPRRVVEVGSGFSTCAILDTNELAFGGAVECTCVEPYPELLRSLLRPGDEARLRVLAQPVQDVDLAVFTALDDGDLLFIDSSHVAKCGSDVNHLYLTVLPQLRPGVYVHVHDVLYPFEYPEAWVEQGRAWNEAYLLRGFLAFNAAFEVVFFNSYFRRAHAEVAAAAPAFANAPGSSIWLRRRPGSAV